MMTANIRKLYTLTIIKDKSYLLLGYKKRGFGQGKINGFGGKVENSESLIECAAREVKEECGVDVTNRLRKSGILEFTFEGDPIPMEVHIYEANGFTGVPVESEEMRPEWHHVDNIPYERMWVDDVMWYPLILTGKCFLGSFHFQGHDTILKYTLNEVEQKEVEIEA